MQIHSFYYIINVQSLPIKKQYPKTIPYLRIIVKDFPLHLHCLEEDSSYTSCEFYYNILFKTTVNIVDNNALS